VGAVAAKAGWVYLPQYVAQSALAAQIDSFYSGSDFAAGYFYLYTFPPADEAGDIFTFIGEVISLQLLSITEKGVADERHEDVLA
jgi:hypothetical protein